MPAASPRDVRASGRYLIVSEQSPTAPVATDDGGVRLAPGVRITVYETLDGSPASPPQEVQSSIFGDPSYRRVYERVVPLPSGAMDAKAWKAWLATQMPAAVAAAEAAGADAARLPPTPGLYVSTAALYGAPPMYVVMPPAAGGPRTAISLNRLTGEVAAIPPTPSGERQLVPEPSSRAWLRALEDTPPRDPATRRAYPTYAGCLLGAAVGEARGAPGAALGWYAQLNLFTAEALLRASVHAYVKTLFGAAPHVLYYTYRRWMRTQGYLPPSPDRPQPHGWLGGVREIAAPGGFSTTVIRALAAERMGDMDAPPNTSKGCGAVPRGAIIGLAEGQVGYGAFDLGARAAAITHGHPTAWLAAGFLAALVQAIVRGAELRAAIDAARAELCRQRDHGECLRAINAAVAAADGPSPDVTAGLGAGRTADAAVAIALACALRAESFSHGITLATSHAGDTRAAGAIAGAILGARDGVWDIPGRWLADLPLRSVMTDVARDLCAAYAGVEPGRWLRFDMDRYPGG